MPGFKGLLIDNLEISKKEIYPMIDIILKGRLFNFITATDYEMKRILELNQEMKGSSVTVFPLTLEDQIKFSLDNLPPAKEATPLMKYIKIKDSSPHALESLLKSYIGRTFIVKDLDTGFRVAETYNVTCVTQKMKIIRPGSFIAKTGHFDISKKIAEPYFALADLAILGHGIESEVMTLEDNVNRVKQMDLDYLLECQGVHVQVKNTSSKLQQNMISIEKVKAQSHGYSRDLKQSTEVHEPGMVHSLEELQSRRETMEKMMTEKALKGAADLLPKRDIQKMKLLEVLKEKTRLSGEAEQIQFSLSNYIVKREQELRAIIESVKAQELKYESQDPRKTEEDKSRKEEMKQFEKQIKSEFKFYSEAIASEESLAQTIAEDDEKEVETRTKLETVIQECRALDRELRYLTGKTEREMKKGHHNSMYDFFIRMDTNFKQFIERIDRLGNAKEEFIDIMEQSKKMKDLAIQDSLKKLDTKFGEFCSKFLPDAEVSLRLVKEENQI